MARTNLMAASLILVAAGVYAWGRSRGAPEPRPMTEKERLAPHSTAQTSVHFNPVPAPPPTIGAGADSLTETPTPSDESDQAKTQPPPRLTPEEARTRIASMRNDRVRKFDHEYEDPTWAPAMAEGLRGELGRLTSKATFNVQAVECRMTLCRAVVRWPNYSRAQKEWRAILHNPQDQGCAKEVYVPSPDDVVAEYDATIIYDCNDAR